MSTTTARDVYVILSVWPYKRLVKQFLRILDDGQVPPAPLVSQMDYFKAKTYRNTVPGGFQPVGQVTLTSGTSGNIQPSGSPNNLIPPTTPVPNTITAGSTAVFLDDALANVDPHPTPGKMSLIRMICTGNDDTAVIGYCVNAEFFVMISDADPAEGEGTE